MSVQVIEDVGDDGGVFDAGDDPHGPAAAAAGLDIDRKDALEPLCPSHRRMAFGGAARRRAPRRAGVTCARKLWLGAKTPLYVACLVFWILPGFVDSL